MKKIDEVNVFSVGDSEKVSTWSNVPYFFVRSLLDSGIKVNRINIQRSLLGKVLNRTVWRLFKVADSRTTYDYFRSAFYFHNVRRQIRRACQRHASADANIFLTFSFSSVGMTDKPTVLFCDWTYDHYLTYFADKKPDRLEEASLKREDRQIEGASSVFVLFPGVAEYMRRRYQNRNIFYLGNVVNAAEEPSESRVLQLKADSQDILFIGGTKYIQGAMALLASFRELKKSRPQLKLHIVGISDGELGELPAGVHCYGYLDKAIERQKELYYALLARAKVLVNPSVKWGAFSAALEAMYFYTPIVTSPYGEFVETFGTELDFGLYCDGNAVADVCAKVAAVLDADDYEKLCRCAHVRVQGFTWKAYVDKLLTKVQETAVPSANVAGLSAATES